MVDVVPIELGHVPGYGCQCEPLTEWIDEESGLPYENGPLVIHEEMRKANGWLAIDNWTGD